MGKTIQGEQRTLILHVLNFFEEEKRRGDFVIPVNQVLKRTCVATGVSLSTISRIKRERDRILQATCPSPTLSSPEQVSTSPLPTPSSEQVSTPPHQTSSLSEQVSTSPLPTSSPEQVPTSPLPTPSSEQVSTSPLRTSSPEQFPTSPILEVEVETCYVKATKSSLPTSRSAKAKKSSHKPKPVVKLPTPGKKRRKPAHNKLVIDDATICSLRKIINSFILRKEIPTLKKVLAVAKADLDFPGQKETLRKIVTEKLGYTFKSKKDLLKERPEIVTVIPDWGYRLIPENSMPNAHTPPRTGGKYCPS